MLGEPLPPSPTRPSKARATVLAVSKGISGAAVGIVFYLVSEAAFISSVAKLGVLATAAIFTVLYGAVSFYLFALFRRASATNSLVGRFHRWATNEATKLQSRYDRIVRVSKVLAVLIASVPAGCFVATVFIALLGYTGRRAYVLIAVQTAFSVTVWALFFSGALRVIFH